MLDLTVGAEVLSRRGGVLCISGTYSQVQRHQVIKPGDSQPSKSTFRSFKMRHTNKVSLQMNHLNLDISHKAIVDSRLSLSRGRALLVQRLRSWRTFFVCKDEHMSTAARAESRL